MLEKKRKIFSKRVGIEVHKPSTFYFNTTLNFPIMEIFECGIEINAEETNFNIGSIPVEICKSFEGIIKLTDIDTFTNEIKTVYSFINKDKIINYNDYIQNNISVIIEKFFVVVKDNSDRYKCDIEINEENLYLFLDYIEQNNIRKISLISTIDLKNTKIVIRNNNMIIGNYNTGR